jgi:2-polyprenyl-3-methyl-5-hydroxy-6-metoxy-1,4-benzoquinol methylase
MDIKEEEILGDKVYSHWYYTSKAKAVADLLGIDPIEEILDIGAGSGIFSKKLIDAKLCNSAVCLDNAYPGDSSTTYHGHSIRFVREVERIDQQLLLMMDVMEHVVDDKAFLAHFVELMPSGAQILISVPAFQFLWSAHDVFLEHQRRYTLKQLQNVVKESGLEIVKARYFFASLFPLIALIRLRDQWKMKQGHLKPKSSLKVYPPATNNFLAAIHDLERYCIFPFNRLAGLTAFCLATKR